jgi:hypothetical protein
VPPGKPDALFVQYHNHVPQARRLATEAVVGWQPSTVGVQPNVTTSDGRAGVQTGELMLVTETGCESLHALPRGLTALPPAGIGSGGGDLRG